MAAETRARDPKTLSRLFESLPPHAIEAEMAVLGSILIDPECAPDAFELLADGDFHKPGNGVIFGAMRSVHEAENTVDVVLLNQWLIDRGQLEAVGGIDHLTALAVSVPSASSMAHYAGLVREKSMRRRLIEVAGELLAEAHGSDDANAAIELLGRHAIALSEASTAGGRDDVRSMAELMREQIGRIERVAGGEPVSIGLESGFEDLDWNIVGFSPGELIVLAGQPGMGKSSLAANFVEYVSRNGAPACIFAMEMGQAEVAIRFLCARANVNLMQYRRGAYHADAGTFRRLMAAAGELSSLPVFIDGRRGVTTAQFRARAHRMVKRHGVKFIMVDYLQLMQGSGRRDANRTAEVGEITRTLKVVAGELGVPILALSQLNRQNVQGAIRRPRMSDLRESGSIEQDADVVLLMHRESYYHRDDPEWFRVNEATANITEIDIAKQRNGANNIVELIWDGEHTCFRNTPRVQTPPAQRQIQHVQQSFIADPTADEIDGIPI